MDLEILAKAIAESWSKETCYPGCVDEWTPENPARGQCTVSALVFQDYRGGDILYCLDPHHYWNEEVDLTRIQFPKGTPIREDGIRSRHHILNSEGAVIARTRERYELLKKSVERNVL